MIFTHQSVTDLQPCMDREKFRVQEMLQYWHGLYRILVVLHNNDIFKIHIATVKDTAAECLQRKDSNE